MKELEFYKKQALEMLSNTFLTEMCWEVSCDNKNFKENVIGVCKTEEEAKNIISDLDKKNTGYMCYRPCVICKDEGVYVTNENLYYFHNESEFVIQLKKDLGFIGV